MVPSARLVAASGLVCGHYHLGGPRLLVPFSLMGRRPSEPIRSTKLRYHLIGRGPMNQIAGQAGIHPTTLSAYSLGYTPIPAVHLIALSQGLDVPEDELVGELDFGDLS